VFGNNTVPKGIVVKKTLTLSAAVLALSASGVLATPFADQFVQNLGFKG